MGRAPFSIPCAQQLWRHPVLAVTVAILIGCGYAAQGAERSVGQTTLATIPGAVQLAAYYADGDRYQHVIVADSSGALHEIFFAGSQGVGHGILRNVGGVVGLGAFYGENDGYQHIFAGTAHGTVEEVFFKPSLGVGQGTLTQLGAGAILDVAAYYAPSDGYDHGIVATADGTLYEVFFKPGQGIGRGPLARVDGAFAITAYFAPTDGYQHVFVAARSGDIIELYFKPDSGEPVRQALFAHTDGVVDVAGYFSPTDQRQHVIVATRDGGVQDWWFTGYGGPRGTVPLATVAGITQVAGYYGGHDGFDHVITLSADGTVSELFFHPSVSDGADALRYDQIQQRFIHNAYGAERDGSVVGGHWVAVGGRKDEQLLDMMIHHRVRAIELDLHPGGICGSQVPDQPDWYIYHDCFDIVSSNVRMLSDALALLNAFHEAQPQHEVVTVNLELGSLKDGKGNESEFRQFGPDQLDNLIRAALGNSLFTPRDLLLFNNQDPLNGSLNAAVRPLSAGGVKGWPTTDDLRGKFLFIVHGAEGDVPYYFGAGNKTIPNVRVSFELDEGRWRDFTSEQFATNTPHIVFHSELDFTGDPQRLRQQLPGHILRIRQIDDGNAGQLEEAQFVANMSKAQASGANFLYMDIVPNRPYVRIHNDRLYPFGASAPQADGTYPAGMAAWQHPAVVSKFEPGSHLRLADKSGGDIDNGPDKFTFAFANLLGEALVTQSWTVEIASVSNKSVHPHGKGFLMARQSLDPTAPYCAVGRTADRYGLRLQYRTAAGGGREFHEYRAGDPYRENYHFVKLEITSSGENQSLCRGYASASGQDGTWEQIGPPVSFAVLLTLKGLTVSSNSGYNVDNAKSYPAGMYSTFDFIHLRKQLLGQPAEVVDLHLFQTAMVGHHDEPLVIRPAP